MGDHLLIQSCCSVINRNNSLLIFLAVLIHAGIMQLVTISPFKWPGIFDKPKGLQMLWGTQMAQCDQQKGMYDHHRLSRNFCWFLYNSDGMGYHAEMILK